MFIATLLAYKFSFIWFPEFYIWQNILLTLLLFCISRASWRWTFDSWNMSEWYSVNKVALTINVCTGRFLYIVYIYTLLLLLLLLLLLFYTFERVENFKYLVVIPNKDKKYQTDLQERLKTANKTYFMLHQNF